MNIAKDRVVAIDYTLTDAKGKVLDTSSDSGPLSYLHGKQNIISGLEKALEGKTEGDKLKVTVQPEDGYGQRDESLVVNVPLDRFQGADSVEAGMQFHAESNDGVRLVTVTKVANGMATVDANHQLAGEVLNFDVTVVAVRAASDEELAHGHPHSPDSSCGCGGCGSDCEGDCDCDGECEDGGCGDEGCGCH